MSYYRYIQNNSGGSFLEPAIEVFIEANTVREADSIARKSGIYFGYGPGDCDCCGERWLKASKYSKSEAIEPNKYASRWETDEIPALLVIKKGESNE